MITLSVPGALEFRDVAVRVVGAACKLFGPHRGDPAPELAASLGSAQHAPDKIGGELSDDFVMQVVSAFSEAFNNLAIHGYGGKASGRIEIEVIPIASDADDKSGSLVIKLTDTGAPFDPSGHLELPDELPERGMGLFIIRSFVDEVRYVAGPPHTLTLVKHWTVRKTTPPP